MFKIVLAFWSKQAKNIIWLDEIKLKKKKFRKGYKQTEHQNALIVTCLSLVGTMFYFISVIIVKPRLIKF